jgi:Putative MetA-pathway of phenol degradation
VRTIVKLATLLLFAGSARAEQPRDFCPDRPGLGTPACTIDRGRFAVELGLVDWTRDRREDEFAAGDLLVRYGLTDRLEMQVGWTAYTHGRAGSGTGDIFVALRRNLRNPDGAGFSAALMPYATLPAGGGDWGAGLLLPLSYRLPDGIALDLTAAADAAVDGDGDGRHFAYGVVLGLDVPVSGAVETTFELSARRDRDPAGATTELLAGLSADWAPSGNLQLDIGANAGLNRASPDLELYVGVARRF